MIERHRGLSRNGRRPVLVVNEAQRARPRTLAGTIRSIHPIDAELVRDVADDQE
jgi:hypothetical protein